MCSGVIGVEIVSLVCELDFFYNIYSRVLCTCSIFISFVFTGPSQKEQFIKKVFGFKVGLNLNMG